MNDEKIEKLLKEFYKQNLLSSDFIYHLLGDTTSNESMLNSESIVRNLKNLEIIGTKNDNNYYLLPKGFSIIENEGGWTKYKQHQIIIENRKERKEIIDLRLANWQVKTFWWLFLLAILGGISGIVSLVMQLKK